jgi:hypothetical protein
VFQAAEKTLENIQPPLSAISTNLSPVIEKEEMIVVKVTEKPAARARSKPKVETKVVNGKTKRTQQTTKKEKKSTKKDVVIEVDEPTYCFCNRISFGKVGNRPFLQSALVLMICTDDRMRQPQLQARMGQ